MDRQIKIYIGAPLFSNAERLYNNLVKYEIEKMFDSNVKIYLPQDNERINDKTTYANSEMIYDADNKMLDEADILVALIDGQTMDVGLASEIGRFAKIAENENNNKKILGLYTDSRQGSYGNKDKLKAVDDIAENQFHYLNLYTVGAIKKNGTIVKNVEELLVEIEKIINKL